MLIRFECDYTLRARHLDSYIGSVDDRYKLQEERPPKDTVVPDVEASHFECDYPCFTRYLQVAAFDGNGRLPWNYPVDRIMHGVKSAKLRPISMKVFLIMRFNEAPLSINVLATLCRLIGILMTNDKFLSDNSVSE
jgi:hypothetical protein